MHVMRWTREVSVTGDRSQVTSKPAGQVAQSPPAGIVPFEHVWHSDDPGAEYEPLAQGVHTVLPASEEEPIWHDK